MSANKYHKQYKKASVQSASKEKILLMLYEGAIKHIKKAKLAIEADDRARRGEHIGYAYDIIMELNTTLNHSVSPEVASNLERLYMFITDQLTQANVKGDAKPLNDSLKVLEILYDGWVQAIEKLKKTNQE